MQRRRDPLVHSADGEAGSGGPLLLIGVFFALLAGRFDVARVFPLFSGVDLRWLILALLTVAFLVWAAAPQRRRRFVPPPAGHVALVLWVVWMAASGVWAVPAADVVDQAQSLFLLLAFIALARGIASRTSPRASVVLFRVVLVTAYAYLFAAVVGTGSSSARFTAFGGGPNVFVRVVVLGALSAVALAVMSRRVWLFMFAAPLLAGSLLSGSRGGVVAAALVVVVAAPLVAWRLGAARFVAGIGLLGAAGFAVWSLVPEASREYLYWRFVELTIEQRYSSGREGLYEYGLELFRSQPIIGRGLGTFAATYRPGDVGFHAHNLLLAVAAEAGFIGVLLLVAAVGIPVWHVLSTRPLRTDVMFLLLAALFVFTASLFSGDYYDSRFMWFFLALAQVWSCPDRGGAVENQEA